MIPSVCGGAMCWLAGCKFRVNKETVQHWTMGIRTHDWTGDSPGIYCSTLQCDLQGTNYGFIITNYGLIIYTQVIITRRRQDGYRSP